MALATRSDLITQALVWLGRPGDTIITADNESDWLKLAEGRIFYGAGPPLESPPARVRGQLGYAQFPLFAVETSATSGGTVNAQTAVLSGYTLTYGKATTIPSGLTNTDSMTLNIEGAGAKIVKKGHNRDTLAAGDWRENISYTAWYDGTDYVMCILPNAIPLPTDFLQPHRAWIGGQKPLEYKKQPEFYQNYMGATAAQPEAYAIDGDHLLLGPVQDASYQLHMLYWKRFAALTTPADTNWLLTNYPSIYLYAMLVESAPFIGHDERIPTWHGLYASAVKGADMQDELARQVDTREPVSADHIVNKASR